MSIINDNVNNDNNGKNSFSIEIDNNCVGCGACVPFCEQEAITALGNATIDTEKCIECHVCVDYCTIGAIKVITK
ncbi:4Fe-4S binding protein [Methanococcus voltae]|uniref:4Fe-4S ferredoxin iron-sulfur binding domain protein n=1 Tax=Methanococcus voltae (strain ATCC BAA-1334 / A3) TaxID=456320 RepID=D7DRR1_METV3|nr:4Fe-4S binding protein [Methanococcus voltae]MCS3901139.1 NAD-dependent dihydropyrimidine dehydrogenase PreA subunit [Methanococcus voltae]